MIGEGPQGFYGLQYLHGLHGLYGHRGLNHSELTGTSS